MNIWNYEIQRCFIVYRSESHTLHSFIFKKMHLVHESTLKIIQWLISEKHFQTHTLNICTSGKWIAKMCYYQQIAILHALFLNFWEAYIQLKAYWEAYPNFSLENINIWEMENILNNQKVASSIILERLCVLHRNQWLWIQTHFWAMRQTLRSMLPASTLRCL